MKKISKKFILLFLTAAMLTLFFGCKNTRNIKPTKAPVEVDGKFKIYCYSVGAADAFLLYTENSSVLIDTGLKDTDSEVYSYIKENCAKHLDAIIITHFDSDHVGGAVKILKKCSIDKIIRPKYAKDSREYQEYAEAVSYYEYEETMPAEPLDFTLDGVSYTVYPPEREDYSDSPSNNSSLIISVKYGSKSFLFCGDAEKTRIKEFLNVHTDKYDFIKMPYHGRWYKALGDLIDITKPDYAVITSSVKEAEDGTTLELLNAYDVETFLTKNAPVLVKCDGDNISVSYCE